LVTDNNAGQSFESSIVRGRVMAFEGWRFGCIAVEETKTKRLLMENRFDFDSISVWLLPSPCQTLNQSATDFEIRVC